MASYCRERCRERHAVTDSLPLRRVSGVLGDHTRERALGSDPSGQGEIFNPSPPVKFPAVRVMDEEAGAFLGPFLGQPPKWRYSDTGGASSGRTRRASWRSGTTTQPRSPAGTSGVQVPVGALFRRTFSSLELLNWWRRWTPKGGVGDMESSVGDRC